MWSHLEPPCLDNCYAQAAQVIVKNEIDEHFTQISRNWFLHFFHQIHFEQRLLRIRPEFRKIQRHVSNRGPSFRLPRINDGEFQDMIQKVLTGDLKQISFAI